MGLGYPSHWIGIVLELFGILRGAGEGVVRLVVGHDQQERFTRPSFEKVDRPVRNAVCPREFRPDVVGTELPRG